MTTAYAKRIRTLRERSGKTAAELSQLLDLSGMEYFDLELHDDELTMVISLEQIWRLAAALGVSTHALLFGDAAAPARRIPYAELVERTKRHLASAGLSEAEFGDQVGWVLDDFFEGEQKMLASYNLEFLKALCAALGAPLQEAIP